MKKNKKLGVSALNYLKGEEGYYDEIISFSLRQFYFLNQKYQDYFRQNHNGKIYCNKCANTILFTGKDSPRWNNNLSQEERINKRKTDKDVIWKKKIFARDKYTCKK